MNTNELDGNIERFTKLKLKRKVKVYVSFKNGLTIRGVEFSNYHLDPFGDALENYKKNNELNDYFFINILEKYYSSEKERKISDYNDIFTENDLKQSPIWSFTYPWDHISHQQKKINYKYLVQNNRREYIQDEIRNSEWFCKSHFNQFKSLLHNIRKIGFIDSFERPKIIILLNPENKQWKWIMSGQGNHRVYLLRYLNYEKIPVSIDYVINLNSYNLPKRPGSGIYDKESLKKLYSNFMNVTNKPLRGIV